jgi:patatin-related protein
VADTTQVVGAEDRQVTVVDAALPTEAPQSAPQDDVRELRLALVCYGGVSLAIYMHGITKELEKLVAASVAYERNQDSHTFLTTDTASVYWSILQRLEEASGVRTRVVVDIVSGTSAGGINGVFLATALARNRSQEPLRKMWIENGDIERLLSGRDRFPKAPKIGRAVWSIIKHRPLLDGARISNWLQEALRQMDAQSHRPVAELESLIGPEDRMQLFVPITDFFGYDVNIPADDPAWILDRTHRHVMHFVHDHRNVESRQLSPDWNDALAFSARATSSFPGAFPAISLKDYERAVRDPDFGADQRRRLFAPYSLVDQPPEKTHFVDGGVLDNKPFGTTLTAIKLRPASSEVDRRVIYIEPDPASEAGGQPDSKAPGLVRTVVGGYAGLPRKEPIVGDLTDLAVHNANVARVRDIIETNFDRMRNLVLGHLSQHPSKDPERPGVDDVTGWRLGLDGQVENESGYLYPTYFRVRIRSVIDNFAQLIADRRGYPRTSSHAIFVGRVLREWAERQGLLEKGEITPEQRQLVAWLDIPHQDRHIRFLIAALSWWYDSDRDAQDTAPEKEPPGRRELDEGKRRLYERLDQLQALARQLTEHQELQAKLNQLFDSAVIRGALTLPVGEFVDDQSGNLGAAQQLAQDIIRPVLESLPAGLDADVVGITTSWKDWARKEMLTRHLGFPFWDAMIYPIEAVSGVGERDHVEVMRISPQEATTLATVKEKDLKGFDYGHFGAFFSREGRENDYLWGRLDGIDRLVTLLLTPPGDTVGWARRPPTHPKYDPDRLRTRRQDIGRGAMVIVEDEKTALKKIEDRLECVKRRAPTDGGA